MTRDASSPGRISPWHVVVYGGLWLLLLRGAWLDQGSGWGRWLTPATWGGAFSLLLASWITEGRRRPRWLHWLVAREPLRLRTRLLLMLVFVVFGLFAGLLVPVHPPVVK